MTFLSSFRDDGRADDNEKRGKQRRTVGTFERCTKQWKDCANDDRKVETRRVDWQNGASIRPNKTVRRRDKRITYYDNSQLLNDFFHDQPFSSLLSSPPAVLPVWLGPFLATSPLMFHYNHVMKIIRTVPVFCLRYLSDIFLPFFALLL